MDAETRGSVAYHEIKRRIVTLAIQPGEMVSETQLAGELGLSKTPIREALGRLQTERLVQVVGRSGYRIVPVTLKDARDLFSARVALEAEAAAQAAEQVAAGILGDKEISLLSQLGRESLNRTTEAEIEAIVVRNAEFHTAVARIAGNLVLADLLDEVLAKCQRMHRMYLRLAPPSHIREHQHDESVQAIAGGNPDEARRVTREILESGAADTIDVLLSSPALLNTNIFHSR